MKLLLTIILSGRAKNKSLKVKLNSNKKFAASKSSMTLIPIFLGYILYPIHRWIRYWVFRYCHVFLPHWLLHPPNKKRLQHLLLLYIGGIGKFLLKIFRPIITVGAMLSTLVVIHPNSTKRYNVCMGHEEIYRFNVTNFLGTGPKDPLWPW